MRHHYIPCFYTKRWIGADKRLCEFSRPHTIVKPKRVYPSGTGYAEDLYAIPQVADDKKHLLETRFMKRIDQKARDILENIENYGTNSLTRDDRLFWATFLISIMQRSPEKLKELVSKYIKKFSQIFANPTQQGGPMPIRQRSMNFCRRRLTPAMLSVIRLFCFRTQFCTSIGSPYLKFSLGTLLNQSI